MSGLSKSIKLDFLKNKEKSHTIYLFISVLVAIFTVEFSIMLIIPPFIVADQRAHAVREWKEEVQP